MSEPQRTRHFQRHSGFRKHCLKSTLRMHGITDMEMVEGSGLTGCIPAGLYQRAKASRDMTPEGKIRQISNI